MRSLRFKLTLAFLLVGLTGAVLAALVLRLGVQRSFDQFLLNRDQQVLVQALLQAYRVNGSWEGVEIALPVRQRPPWDNEPHPEDVAHLLPFTLIGPQRTVIFTSLNDQVGRTVGPEELKNALPLVQDGQPIGWLLLPNAPRLPSGDTPESRFIVATNRAAWIAALTAMGLAVVLGGLLSVSLTGRLRKLTDTALQIAQGKLGVQAPVSGADELGELGQAFNKMSRDLARADQARRQMTADVAHDLRSPLSVIGGYTEALSDGKLPGTPEIYAVLYQETTRLNHLVDDLRTLSLADAGELAMLRIATSPAALVDQAAARFHLSAEKKDVRLLTEIAPDLPNVQADPERMAQVLDNLLANALRYTPSGGAITLSAAASASGGVLLSVADTGPGIPPEDLPFIFDRFYRADKSRHDDASGLGLAIARSIVEAHGGSLIAENAPSGGARFVIEF